MNLIRCASCAAKLSARSSVKSAMRSTTTLTAVFASLLLIVCAARAEESPRTISATGEASVYVAPDEVVVNLGVETFNPQLDEAKSANDVACKKLLASVRDLGVEDKQIQTDVLNVQIDYQESSRPSKGIEGYFCRRGYAVTLKDVSKFERLVDTALKNGANHLMGFEFRTTELRKHRDRARQMAIRAAHEKAVALAGALDMTVGSPRTISEGYNNYFGYRGWWGWGGGGYGQYMAQNAQFDAGGSRGGEDTMPVGQVTVRAQVSVTFDMAPAAITTMKKAD